MFWVGMIVGLSIGVCVGVVLSGLLRAARDNDDGVDYLLKHTEKQRRAGL